MKPPSIKLVRCAIYTRVSTDHGLDQEFNSLDAQHDAASAYIKSQAHAGWTLIKSRYDDGGYSGGSTDRPDLQRLLDDIRARKLDVIVVYKVDRLTRSRRSTGWRSTSSRRVACIRAWQPSCSAAGAIRSRNWFRAQTGRRSWSCWTASKTRRTSARSCGPPTPPVPTGWFVRRVTRPARRRDGEGVSRRGQSRPGRDGRQHRAGDRGTEGIGRLDGRTGCARPPTRTTSRLHGADGVRPGRRGRRGCADWCGSGATGWCPSPWSGQVGSLNVSVAAGIALFEAVRQRRAPGRVRRRAGAGTIGSEGCTRDAEGAPCRIAHLARTVLPFPFCLAGVAQSGRAADL